MAKKPWIQWEVGETTNLEARKYRRTELLHSQREEFHKNKLVFNITYYPIFSKLKNILSKIYLLLTPDREHRKVFENVSIIGFKIGKSLKDILFRAKVPPPRRVSVVLATNQGVKFANMLPKHTNLNRHLRSAYISLDHKIWIALLRM